MKTVLAIDPGRAKCGLAVASENGLLYKSIIHTDEIAGSIKQLIGGYGVEAIVIGNGTYSGSLVEEVEKLNLPLPIEIVEEAYSTQRARVRYFQENPRRGLWRLIPVGLLFPPCAVDDYAAVILAEDYIGRSK